MDEVSLIALQNEIAELEKALTVKKRQLEELQSVKKKSMIRYLHKIICQIIK